MYHYFMLSIILYASARIMCLEGHGWVGYFKFVFVFFFEQNKDLV